MLLRLGHNRARSVPLENASMIAPRSLILPVIVMLILGACARQDDGRPNANDFRIKGWSQTQVRAGFGEPKLTQSFRKKAGDPVWGEIENVWHRVPEGATVDIWVYEVQGGNIELYFIRPSSLVWEIGFSPEGAVY